MATTLVTPRDIDLFAALERSPLTVRQLLKLSQSFAFGFTTERRVQERLQQLCAVGRLRRWSYATAGRGALSYFTLSSEGYRILHGHDAAAPSKGMFGAIGVARQRHAHALADFIIHLYTSAQSSNVEISSFHRENALALTQGEEVLYPDCAFAVTTSAGATFRYFVEIDNSTESIRSRESLDTWQRKIAFYERYQDAHAERFRVLAVTLGGVKRLQNILDCAQSLARNPRRSLIYGATLSSFLASDDALNGTEFRDHLSKDVSLLPQMPLLVPRVQMVSVTASAPKMPMVVSAACLEPLPQA